jgi:N-acetylmuramoyl-L-alanine amidase-like protein
MARWTNLISRQESTGNRNAGGMREFRGLVVHTAEGSYEGTISWQQNPASAVSSQFVVGKNPGEWAQMMDDHDEAWTQRDGNGHWLSSENAGFGSRGEALTAWQVEANAQLLAEAHRRYGVPLEVAVNPNGRGLGHHSMGGTGCTQWNWGHCDCPGAAIIAQKSAVVARAQELVGGSMIGSQETSAGHTEAIAGGIATRQVADEQTATDRDAALNAKVDALNAKVDALTTAVAALAPGDITMSVTGGTLNISGSVSGSVNLSQQTS